jgi:saccharopine dehydrogenase (NAD+, L-lysine-forming)
MVGHNTWPSAPSEALILGLKELPPNDDSPLKHTHIMFGHCYKQQAGYKEILNRFKRGNGRLLDLEFLQDPHTKRRVAAFGFYAGFNGSAVGLLGLSKMVCEGTSLSELKPFKDEDELVSLGKVEFEKLVAKLGRHPRALVIGALGRCGSGAVSFFHKVGMKKCVHFSFPPSMLCSLPLNTDDENLGRMYLNGTWQRPPKVVHSKRS